MSSTDEALKIWNALKPMIYREIEAKTRSCVRAKKMTVTTAPDGSVIGVTESYGAELFVPYLSALSGASAGDSVWVWYFYNNASTMIAMAFGNGQIPSDSMTVVNVEGTEPEISAESNTLYMCGEVTSVSFTPPASGVAEIIFTSGGTAASLTLPETVLLPDGFDPSALETDTIYEISVLNGVYVAVLSWAAPAPASEPE